MKLLTKCFYALFLMGFSLNLSGNIESTVSVRCQQGKSFSLHLKGMQNETYTIKLSDSLGFIFINEKVEDQDDFMQFYNLKNLPKGDYLLKIENKRKISLQTISVNNQKLEIKTSTKKEIYKPSVKVEHSYLDLNMLNFEDDAVSVIIKDKQGYTLHKEKFFIIGSITKRFRLNALPFGDYIFEIETKNYTYEHEFSITSDNKIQLMQPTIGE